MRLSQDVWILWGWRLLAVNILIYPAADNFTGTIPLLIFGNLLLIIFLVIRLKSTYISLDKRHLTFEQGFFLRRKVCIRLSKTCALRKLSTPLSRHLRLSNLIIYCEGAWFLLPPMKGSVVSEIEIKIQKPVT